jgi:hypothetical protein
MPNRPLLRSLSKQPKQPNPLRQNRLLKPQVFRRPSPEFLVRVTTRSLRAKAWAFLAR